MPDDLSFVPEEGPFLSFLDWIDRPGQVVRNLLKGRGAAAGRQAKQFLGEIPDAFLPGNAIPDVTERGDDIAPHELVGMDDTTPWYLRVPTDIGLGIATDPLSYLRFGVTPSAIRAKRLTEAGREVPKGGGVTLGLPLGPKMSTGAFEGQDVDPLSMLARGLGKAVEKAPPAVRNPLQGFGRGVRSMLGTEKLSPEAEEIMSAADAARTREGHAGSTAAQQIVAGLTPEEDRQAYLLARNLQEHEPRQFSEIIPAGDTDPIEHIDTQIARLHQAAAQIGASPQVTAAAEQALRLGNTQFKLGRSEYGIFNDPQRYMRNGKPVDVRQLGKLFRIEMRNDRTMKQFVKKTLAEGELNGAHISGKLDEALKLGAEPDRFGELEQQLQGVHDHMRETQALDNPVPLPQEFEKWLDFNGVKKQALPMEYSPRNYVQVSWKGMENDPRALEARKIHTPQQMNQFLQKNPDISLDTDLGRALLRRSQQQANLSALAEAGKRLVAGKGIEYRHASEDARNAALAAMDDFDPESAMALRNLMQGQPPRGGFMRALATMNRFFKPYVVAGFIAPRFSSLFRNRLSAPFMVGATPNAGAAMARAANPAQMAQDVIASLAEAYGFKAPGELAGKMHYIEDAYKASGGSAAKAVELLRQGGHDDLADAVHHGVLDGFTNTEQLLDKIRRTGVRKFAMDLIDRPMTAFQGTEHHMRLGAFLDLRNSGKELPKEAARLTQEALYNYRVNSPLNDRFRQAIPFGQFLGKSLVQQSKAVSRSPAYAVGLSQIFGQDQDHPTYPYLSEKAGFRVDPQTYVGGLGLPAETLSLIPGLNTAGRDVERGVVASSQPLLKSGYAAMSGHDPYFGTPFGSYDKLPITLQAAGAPEHSTFGKYYNEATGLGVNPLQPAFGQLDQVLNPKRSLGVKALDVFTGANVVDVDESKALQQEMENYLRANPNIRSHTELYQTTEDEQTKHVLSEYKRLKKQISEQKKREKLLDVT